MKIALAQLNFRIGDFELNTKKIIDAVAKAKTQNADIIVFSELAVCGYPPQDLLNRNAFAEKCEEAISNLTKQTDNIAIVIGSPCINKTGKGKNLFNAAFFLFEGKIQFIQHKALLPDYDVFDEYRYFEPGGVLSVFEFQGKKIGISICEDIWNENNLYQLNATKNFEKNIDIQINIAASPFHYNQFEKRKAILKQNAVKFNAPLIYVNQVGANTDLIFDGASLVMNEKGEIEAQMSFFEEGIGYFDTETQKSIDFLGKSGEKPKLIYDALTLGIKDYFEKSHFKKAILGLSGGIDSAVTLALASAALGKENVFAVMLPSMYSSKGSVEDSLALVENLGCFAEKIPITPTYKSFEGALSQLFAGKKPDVTEENLQARIRGNFLMALSNKFGYILLNTSNKSELAVGYGTIYGDLCGGLAVLGDVYKTQVYDLAKYINREKEIIPENILTKAPSAELSPNQKDSDALPDYTLLDKILFQFIEEEKGLKEIVQSGFDRKVVNKIIALVNRNEYKRFQSPPILRISPKSFGIGRKFPLVGKLTE